MRDLIDQLIAWHDAGEACAIATVVDTSASAPRLPGAAMALGPDGTVVGSVSGGCVEGAVVELARETLVDGSLRRHRFGYSDDEAFAVGLTCGGEIEIVVERLDGDRWGRASAAAFAEVVGAVAAPRPVAVATVVGAPPGDVHPGARLVVTLDAASQSLGSSGLDVAVTADARGLLAQGATGIRRYGADGERRADDVEVFVQSFAPPPRMLVFGAIDYAAAVARIGSFLGYRVTVCDARAVFATPRRFPDADEVVVEWPHRYLDRTEVDDRTVICVLTHDPKFDVPVLERALRTPAAYIGAMGSRRTHDERLARLREAGLSDAELARLRSPIGLDLGGRTPEETAVSVAAELIALRWGGSGVPLTEVDGPVHQLRSPVT